MSEADVELVRKMVRPLALKLGGPFLAPRIMAGLTPENLRVVYADIGEEGIRAAADAFVRIGKEPHDDGGSRT